MTMEGLGHQQSIETGGSKPGFATIGVASAIAIPPNPQRKLLIIVNDSASIVYGAKGAPAVVGSGARLNAQGGVWTIKPDAQGYIWKGDIRFISAVAARNISWIEDW